MCTLEQITIIKDSLIKDRPQLQIRSILRQKSIDIFLH